MKNIGNIIRTVFKRLDKEEKEERPSLSALYFRLYIRQNRIARWEEMKEHAPQVIVDSDRALLAKVQQEIADRHAEIKEQADLFGKI